MDESPLFDKSSYYRLKQTDYDGKSSYSETISITNQTSYHNAYNVYLDPVNSTITVNLNTSDKEVLISVNDILGNEYYSATVYNESKGINHKIELQSKLKQGVYLIIAEANDLVHIRRMMIR